MPSTIDETKTTFSAASRVERPTIAAEANFLRLPLFALHTKGLSQLDGFECRGTRTRGDDTWDFVFRTARSTATIYPGLLSRSVHLAFLSLITEHGLPFTNPVTWTWYKLCDRLAVQPSGRTVQRLKAAIEATAGLTIYSTDALYSKPTGKRLSTQKAMHLYETVIFVNGTMPDGQTADTNYLWLSDWYLDNLNALFTAPLDHELWRFLDKQSPIASRLYEFLLINFHGRMPHLQINYPRLAEFLPVRRERYLSDARKQLEPAFRLLMETGVAGSISWHNRREDMAQLRFVRGERLLRRSSVQPQLMQSHAGENALISVREVRRNPELDLVDHFYRLWAGKSGQRPYAADLELARRLIAQYGQTQVKTLLPLVIDQLKLHWPGAKTFVAVEKYIGAAAEQHQEHQRREKHRRDQEKMQDEYFENHARESRERQQFETNWLPIWESLPEGDRDEIRTELLARYSFLRRTPNELQYRCLQELARRAAERGDTVPGAGETDLRTARNPRL